MIIYVKNLMNLVCVVPQMNKYMTILSLPSSVNIKAVNTVKVSAFKEISEFFYNGKGCTRTKHIV